MAKCVKTAVSVPETLYAAAEKLRKKRRLSRSGLYTRALKELMRVETLKEMDSAYADGYRKHPERPEEVEPFLKASLETLEPGDW